MKILVACANGSGTSLMASMTAERVCKKFGLDAQVHHTSLSEGKNTSVNYDVVFCPQNFANMFTHAEERGVTVIGLRNVLSDKEMEEKMREKGIIKD